MILYKIKFPCPVQDKSSIRQGHLIGQDIYFIFLNILILSISQIMKI